MTKAGFNLKTLIKLEETCVISPQHSKVKLSIDYVFFISINYDNFITNIYIFA